MPRFACVAVAALIAAPGAAARAQTPSPGPTLVVVTGEGVVTAAPDRAFVGVSVESRGPNPRDVQRRNAEVMRKVQDRLRSLTVASEAMQTTTVDLRMEYDFVDGKRVSRGYLAVNSIDVRVDALERLGELVDGAVGAGATSVSDVRFDVKDRAALERRALRLAVEDARARAQAAAEGAGGSVDRVLRIEEAGVAGPPEMPVRMMAARDAAVETPVVQGPIELRARVTLTAALGGR